MAEYQLTHTPTVIRTADGAFIPDDPANRDRADYTAWVEAGGVPDPPDPLPEPPPPPPDANARLDAGVDAAVDAYEAAPVPEQIDASSGLAARVDRLEATVRALLQGHMSHLEPSPQL